MQERGIPFEPSKERNPILEDSVKKKNFLDSRKTVAEQAHSLQDFLFLPENEQTMESKMSASTKLADLIAAKESFFLIGEDTAQQESSRKRFKIFYELLGELSLHESVEQEDVLINCIYTLDAKELETIFFEIIDLPFFKKGTSARVMAALWKRALEQGVPVQVNTFFNYGDAPYDKLDSRINARICNALFSVLSENGIALRDREEGFASILHDVFSPPELWRYARKDFIGLFAKLYHHPELKEPLQPILMNYWFQWSDALKKEVNSLDVEQGNVSAISNYLVLAGESYRFLMESGMQPNEDYADFMLQFIQKCRASSRFFIQLKANLVAERITATPEEIEFYYPEDYEDWQSRGRWQMQEAALSFFGVTKKREDRHLTKKVVDGKDYYTIALAPDLQGFFNDFYELEMVQDADGHIMHYHEFTALNYNDLVSQENFYDVIYLQNLEARDAIQKKFGVDLATLDIRAQHQFINFLKESGNERIKRLETILRKNQGNSDIIASAFLACAEDVSFGDNILSIAEELGNDAIPLFRKYIEILDVTKDIRLYLIEYFGNKGSFSEQQMNSIITQLLHRANGLFLDFITRAGDQRGLADILQSLSEIKTNTLLFASAFKTLSKEEHISLENIRDTEFVSKNVRTLTSQEKTEMVEMLRENRRNYQPEVLASSLHEFNKVLEGEGSQFYLLRHKEELVAFIRFEPKPDGSLYAGSLNVRKEIRGSALGTALLRATLDRTARDWRITAKVHGENPMMKHYVNNFRLFITHVDTNYRVPGQLGFLLERDDRKTGSFRGVELTEEEIIAMSNMEGDDIYKVFSFNVEKERDQLTRTLKEYVNNDGFIVTHYIERSPMVYVVLEKLARVPEEELALASAVE